MNHTNGIMNNNSNGAAIPAGTHAPSTRFSGNPYASDNQGTKQGPTPTAKPGGFQSSNARSFQPIQFTKEERSRIQTRLNKVLGPEYVSFRPGGGGQNVSYIEGWKALNLANEIFGFDGWCSELINSQVDYVDTHGGSGRISMGFSVLVRVTIKNGTFHEDFGYGSIENAKNRAMAFEKCRKEAFTDGLKRCLRSFGNVLGNCLYDKQIISKIQKVKLPPPELEDDAFYRDPLYLKRERLKKGTVAVNLNSGVNLNRQTPLTRRVDPVPTNLNHHDDVGPEEVELREDPKVDPNIIADFDDSYVFSDDFPHEDELDDYELQLINQKLKQNEPEETNEPTEVPQQVAFITAKLADLIRESPDQISNLPTYNTRFISQSMRRTVDPNKSVPIRRTEALQSVKAIDKRMIGVPPRKKQKPDEGLKDKTNEFNNTKTPK